MIMCIEQRRHTRKVLRMHMTHSQCTHNACKVQNALRMHTQRQECTQKHERQTECEALTWNRFRLHTNRLRMVRHTQNRLRLLETHSECVQKTLIHRHQDIGKHKSTEQHPPTAPARTLRMQSEYTLKTCAPSEYHLPVCVKIRLLGWRQCSNATPYSFSFPMPRIQRVSNTG
jgi:hypothetical protein